MSVPHEEFEAIAHLDQTFRTVTTAAAQTVEMMLRRAAERDRAAAQDARSAALAERQRGLDSRDGGPGSSAQSLTPQDQQRVARARGWLQDHDPAIAQTYGRNGGPSGDSALVERAQRLAQMEGGGLQGVAPANNPRRHAMDAASFEYRAMVLPEGDANADRGYAPSQAQTLAEMEHRERAWTVAREEFVAPNGTLEPQREAQWNAMTDEDRQRRFWAVYDMEPVRHVTVQVPLDGEGKPVVKPEQVAPAEVLANAVSDTRANLSASQIERQAAITEDQELAQLQNTGRAAGATASASQPPRSDGRDDAASPPVVPVQGPRTPSDTATAPSSPELQAMVIPAYRDNPDRGVAPSKAATPEEAQHRRQAWRIAQDRWAATQPAGQGTQAAWNRLDSKAKTDMYWKAYDTSEARSIGGGRVERGMSPSKASTPGEKEHRTKAWAMANERFAADHPELTPREAEREFKKLDWQDTAMYYWPAYDDPASQATARTAPSADVAASTLSSDAPASSQDRMSDDTVEMPAVVDADEPFDPYGADASYGPDEPTVVQDAGNEEQQASRERPDDRQVVDQAEHVVAEAVAAGAVAGIVSEELAQHGVERDREQQTSRERVVELNTAAAQFFRDQATPDSKGGSYLQERLGAEVVNDPRWQLGYAPEGWTNLTTHLRRTQGASDRELLDSGLGRESSRGTVIDTFRDRAMIGVRDLNGDTVGFVGRDLSGAPNAPKYTNTGQTPAYTKGEHLLGLHEAPQGAQLWRVEGPMDAIALSAAGDGKAAGIAPLGTALSSRQADLLVEHAGGKVWAALDNDAAGQAALVKDFEALGSRGVDVRAVTLPGSDPAEIWQRDPDQLRRTVSAADVWPSAGTTVLESWAEEHREGLTAGIDSEIRAYFAKVDDVTSKVPASEREAVATEAQAVLNGINSPRSQDNSRSEPERMSANSTVSANSAGSVTAAHMPEMQTTQGTERRPAAYDRAADSRLDMVQDPEAIEARRVSAHGFSRSTPDMLQGSKDAPHAAAPSSSSALRQTHQQTVQRTHRMR